MDFDTLGLTLTAAKAPIYLVDQEGVILFANQALADWLEIDLSELVGKQTAYHGGASEDRTSRGVLGICPPPSALQGERQTATVSCVQRKGGVRHRRGEFWPLDLGDGAPRWGVLALLESRDMTREQLAVSLNPIPQPDPLHRLLAQQRATQAAAFTQAGLVGESPALVLARLQVQAAADSRAAVLVRGNLPDELRAVAEAIHFTAHGGGEAELVRMELPLALPLDWDRALAKGRSGRGTLLLENAHHLNAAQQQELSTALASKEWSWQVVSTIAMSEGDETPVLPAELRARLAAIEIYLPPLAKRLEDLPVVAQWCVENLNRDTSKQVEGFTDDALERLALYDWPGGVAELQNTVALAHASCRGPRIEGTDLPRVVRNAVAHAQLQARDVEPIDLDDYLARVESLVVHRALELAGGNKAEASRLLGVSRPRLYRKLEQMGLLEPVAVRPASRPTPSSTDLPPVVEVEEIEFLPVDETENPAGTSPSGLEEKEEP